jgi:hypothetical protein
VLVNLGQTSEYEMPMAKQSDRKRTTSEYETTKEKEKKKIHRQTINVLLMFCFERWIV